MAAAFDLPWSEDFELAEGESSLFTLDWWTPTDGFTGYAWEVTYSDAHGGESSAVHESGSPEVGELSDWLISPALNFASLDQIMVRWMERGSLLDSFEGHGLYLSTGSRSPEDGDFVAVEDALPVPESEWARSASYDLSEWAGEPVVYLAWKYVGTDADQWWLDDVEVLELAPDLHASLGWAPNPVHPGESVSLTIALDNHTESEATGLTGTLSLPDGGGTIVEPEVAVESIDGLGSYDLYFTLELDPELHDNRALPLRLELTDGLDSWGFDLEMIVGFPVKLWSHSLSMRMPAFNGFWCGGSRGPDLGHHRPCGSSFGGDPNLGLWTLRRHMNCCCRSRDRCDGFRSSAPT